ncbi:hypothetical protein [Bordetella phage vB_BbrM_PHB04]|uniref:Uncharacterized protein n=1 Tax=Bordetella phage vB_BbrM_PHB04 TaxID=2029657 RepID=A0A291L9W6_9CAUD|nr:head maturation protease [Bordetella phage vB_BbrM_PHB04]ATI15640.1 hypothetical protein [Bordetella phage vB_BbrM_PHB04]
MDQRDLLASVPEYLSIGSMLKATPMMDGGRRFVFIEASNEATDQQNEVVLQKALSSSSDYYLRYGNLDIDHITQIGAKAGIPDYTLFEIGRPVEARFADGRTFVKGEIFAGTGPAAERANQFWSSVTEVDPPARWYPSVGGAVLEKAVEIDPTTKLRKAFVKRVRWTNIGFSKTPVNQTVPTVATVPFGALAKCWGVGGLDLSKALEAGYATDAVGKTGGAALGMQSLDAGGPANYFDFRNKLADAMRHGAAGDNPGIKELVEYSANTFGLSRSDAAEWVERFVRDLKTGLKKRSKP